MAVFHRLYLRYPVFVLAYPHQAARSDSVARPGSYSHRSEFHCTQRAQPHDLLDDPAASPRKVLLGVRIRSRARRIGAEVTGGTPRPEFSPALRREVLQGLLEGLNEGTRFVVGNDLLTLVEVTVQTRFGFPPVPMREAHQGSPIRVVYSQAPASGERL